MLEITDAGGVKLKGNKNDCVFYVCCENRDFIFLPNHSLIITLFKSLPNIFIMIFNFFTLLRCKMQFKESFILYCVYILTYSLNYLKVRVSYNIKIHTYTLTTNPFFLFLFTYKKNECKINATTIVN